MQTFLNPWQNFIINLPQVCDIFLCCWKYKSSENWEIGRAFWYEFEKEKILRILIINHSIYETDFPRYDIWWKILEWPTPS